MKNNVSEENPEPKKKKTSRFKSGMRKIKSAGKHLYIGKRPEKFRMFSTSKLGTLAVVVVILAIILQVLRNR